MAGILNMESIHQFCVSTFQHLNAAAENWDALGTVVVTKTIYHVLRCANVVQADVIILVATHIRWAIIAMKRTTLMVRLINSIDILIC